MPLSTEKLANLPLNGQELKAYTRKLLDNELQKRGVPNACVLGIDAAFETAMVNDFISRETAAYPEVTVELNLKLHYAMDEWIERGGEQIAASAFELQPVFRTINILAPTHAVVVRSPKPPIKEFAGRGTVVAFQLTSKVENPNLVRVHYGIPIVIQKRKEPEPGKMFADIESETLTYTPEDFPGVTLPEPLVIDQSEEVAALWGIRMEVMPTGTSKDANGVPVNEAAAIDPILDDPRRDPDPGIAAASSKKNRKGWNKTHGSEKEVAG